MLGCHTFDNNWLEKFQFNSHICCGLNGTSMKCDCLLNSINCLFVSSFVYCCCLFCLYISRKLMPLNQWAVVDNSRNRNQFCYSYQFIRIYFVHMKKSQILLIFCCWFFVVCVNAITYVRLRLNSSGWHIKC